MKKFFSRLTASFLTMVFLLAQQPILAQELAESLASGTQGINTVAEPQMLDEVTEKRSEFIKHFRMSDGSMKAIVYSNQVHYKDGNEFKEIDNTLIEGEEDYTNTESPLNVKVSKSFNDNKLVSINSDGHEISWSYIKKNRKIIVKKMVAKSETEQSAEEAIQNKDSAENSESEDLTEATTSESPEAFEEIEVAEALDVQPDAISVENFKTKTKNFVNKKEEKIDASKASSKAKFKNADPEVDLDYTISGLSFKENIILNKKLDFNSGDSFNFEFKTNGLKLEKDNAGNLNFVDENGKIAFSMPKGSMWDSGEGFSNDVNYEFKENENGYIIFVIPNYEWINSAERVFPIFIDPPITLPYLGDSSYEYTVTDPYNPNTNSSNHDHIPVGTSNANYQSFLRYTALPNFSHGEMVTDAAFEIALPPSYPNGFDVYFGTLPMQACARSVTSAWQASTLTYANRPSISSTICDYFTVDTVGKWYDCDITKLTKDWYSLDNPNSNFGFELDTLDPSQFGLMRFISKNTSSYPGDGPRLTISYRNFIGEEPYWSYTGHNAGLNGYGKVNNYAGTLSVSENLLSYSGSRNPVSITNTYNSPYFNKQPNSRVFKTDFLNGYSHSARTGLGWSLDFNQLLYEIPDTDPLYSVPEKWRYLYIDDDGTWHYFREIQIEENGVLVTKIMDEDGLYFEIKTSGSNLEIIDKGGNTLTFSKVYGSDACFSLINSQDFCGNTTTYYYDKEPGTPNSKVSRITDAVGRETHVAYDLTHGMVSEITEADGRITKFIYDGERLSEIIYPDESRKELKTGYIYDERGRLARVWTNAGTGSSVGYAYASNSETSTNFFKVRSVTEFGSKNSDAKATGNSVHFDYEMNQTKITHKAGSLDVPYHKNTTTWIFDDHGRVMSVMDENGEAMAQVYRNEEENINLDPNSNYAALCAYKVKHTNGVHKYANNLLKNSAAIRQLDNWTVKDWLGNTAPQITTPIGEASLGEKSFKVENNANNSWPIAEQKVSIVPSKSDRKFTLSADIKIDGTLNGGSGAALHLAAFKGEVQKSGDEYSEWLLDTQGDWRRISVTINVPADADSIKCYFGTKESIGTAYFDCLQLEENEFASDYNMIENSSFDSSLEGWTPNSEFENATDKIENGKLKIIGKPTANKEISQIIPINKVNPVFTVSATGKGATVPNNVNKIATNPNSVTSYGVKLGINFADNTQKWVDVYFNPSVAGPQRTCGSVAAKDYGKGKVVTSIEVRPAFYSNCNTVYFDDIQVCTGSFGWSAEYDKNTANAETVTNNLGKETNFGYTAQNEVSTATKVLANSAQETTSFGHTDANPRNLTSRTSPIVSGNIEPKFTYDTYGNVITATFGDDSGSPRINSATEYTANKDYNYPEKITDSRGFETLLNYNKNNGNLDSITNANNVTANYTYDASGRMKSASCGNVETNYEYSNGVLSKITNSMGVAYNFIRDIFGKITQSKVGDQVLITNRYDAGNGLLKEVKYNNNQISRFDYDKLGRMIKKQNLAGKIKTEFEYTYDDKNRLVQSFDSENNLTIKIEYDKYGRISHIRRSDNVSNDFTFDNDRDSISKAILKLFGLTQTVENVLGPSGILEKSKIKIIDDPNNQNNYIWSKYTYDELGRIKFKDTSNFDESAGIRHEISYTDGNLPNSTTGLIDSIEATNTGATLNKKFSYRYDNLGNIEEIYEDNDVDPKIQYFYDNLNRLQKENNGYLGETIKYEYDLSGNITKKEFYTDETETTLKKTVTYNYNDSNWKDKLSSYEIQYEQGFVPQDTEAYTKHSIIHDGIGNATDYKDGWKFEWRCGRQLDKMSNKGYNVNISCKYDEGGIRTQKTVTSVENGNSITKTTDFVTNGIQVLAQKTGDDTIVWQIAANGAVVGFTHIHLDGNGDEQTDTYFYLKNAQGDIIGITDSSGDIIAEYIYDSWGKLLHVLDAAGTEITDSSHIAQINPLRYRGYYYDTETNLYYLNARYYDPETGRFINADDNLEGGLNLFAYCYNDPVNRIDPTGLSGILQIFAHEYHAWIAYTEQVEYIDNQGIKQTKNIKTQTIGTWGEHLPSGRQSGVHYDMEANGIANKGWYKGRVSLSANITDEQEKNLFDFIAKNNNWSMFKNCSWFAANAWEAAGQKSLGYKALGIVPTPTVLARSIKTVSGYQTNASTVPTGIPVNPQKGNSSWNPLYILDDLSYLWKQI